jgi:hypothetical protein
MAIRTIALSALTAAALAGCGTTYDEPAPVTRVPAQPAAPVVSATPSSASAGASASTPVALATLKSGTFRAGNGILESIGLITLPASAAAGATTAANTPVPGPYRLTIRMDDGNIQTVQADTRALLVATACRSPRTAG